MLIRQKQKTCWSIFSNFLCQCSPVKLLLVLGAVGLIVNELTSPARFVSTLDGGASPNLNVKHPQFFKPHTKKQEQSSCRLLINGEPSDLKQVGYGAWYVNCREKKDSNGCVVVLNDKHEFSEVPFADHYRCVKIK